LSERQKVTASCVASVPGPSRTGNQAATRADPPGRSRSPVVAAGPVAGRAGFRRTVVEGYDYFEPT